MGPNQLDTARQQEGAGKRRGEKGREWRDGRRETESWLDWGRDLKQ
jgi:hypothetical protein